MQNDQRLHRLYVFSQELAELEEWVVRMKKGETPSPDTINALDGLEKKYYHRRNFYYSLKPALEEFRKLLPEGKPPQREEQRVLSLFPHSNNLVTLVKPESKPKDQSAGNTSLPQQQLIITDIVTPPRLFPQVKLYSPPTPQLIHDFYGSQGIVGEENNRELLFYGTLARANIGIESLAGSGKSALLKALLKALPKDSYQIIHQATGKSLFNDPERNRVKLWVIPELQKVFTQDIEDLLKNLTEGDSATHRRTNSHKDGVDNLEIKEKSVLYTFAITNKHLRERDDEFYRRFIILHTDISIQQNLKVAKNNAELRFTDKKEIKINELLLKRVAAALDFKGEVRNPFGSYIVESLPSVISGHMRFRSYEKYLHSLVAGCTLFYSPQLDTEKEVIFSTLQDNQRIINLYRETLINNLYGLSVVEKAILDLSSEEPQLHSKLLEKISGTYSGAQDFYDAGIKRLISIGLLKSDSQMVYRNDLPEIKLDLEKALATADDQMKEIYPESRDEWYALNNISTQSPSIQQSFSDKLDKIVEQDKNKEE